MPDRLPRPALASIAQAALAKGNRESLACALLALNADISVSAARTVLEACAEPEPSQPRQQGFDDDADHGDRVPADRPDNQL